MKWFYDMKIGARLITAFVIVGAITAIVGYMGINSMGNIAELAASLCQPDPRNRLHQAG